MDTAATSDVVGELSGVRDVPLAERKSGDACFPFSNKTAQAGAAS